ncbi:MFS transporter [Lolliginicoccus suaedae]|uniref:MFS transporter n=1 Tax=Lolliginicoccus suaedae TaxID=2605429 RepID=UPI001CA8632D|nr:MFS transporter [Lolliginicoccus suaedae]
METRKHGTGLGALLLMTALAFGGHAILFPTVPLWVVEHGAGTTGAGAVNAVLMLFTVLTQLAMPATLRRLGWPPTLVLGVLLLGLPSLLQLLAQDLGPVLALAALRGIGFGIITVCGATAVAELADPARRGAAIGAYGFAIAAPQFVLTPAAPWAAQNLGYGIVFLAGACPILAVLPALRLGRAVHAAIDARATSAAPSPPRPVLRDTLRALIAPMLILLGVTAAGGALLTFTPQMTTSATAALLGLLALTGIAAISRWWFGILADRHGTRPYRAPLIGLTLAGLLLAAWAVTTPTDTNGLALIAGLALIGIAYGGLQNLTLIDSFAYVGPRQYSTASTTWNIGFDAGTGLGAITTGYLAAQQGFPVALLALAAIALATMPLALRR